MGRNRSMYLRGGEKQEVHFKKEGDEGRAKKLTLKGLLGKLPTFEIFFFQNLKSSVIDVMP